MNCIDIGAVLLTISWILFMSLCDLDSLEKSTKRKGGKSDR